MTPAQTNDKQVVIITGGTKGIGLSLAKDLLTRGYRVAISGRGRQDGETAASELDPTGDTVMFAQCDVASYASQTALFTTVWRRWGRLDVLVANAGIVDRDSLYHLRRRDAAVDDVPPEPDLGCIDVDLRGVIYGTVLATHFMRHNRPGGGGGKILVSGSLLGVYPGLTVPEYCAAKAGALHWVRTMAPLLLSKENITINCVLLGPVATTIVPNITDAVRPENLTLPSCFLSAYNVYLDDQTNTRTGEAVVTLHDSLEYLPLPEFIGGDFSRLLTFVYEPRFIIKHGENSGLPGAMLEPLKKG